MNDVYGPFGFWFWFVRMAGVWAFVAACAWGC